MLKKLTYTMKVIANQLAIAFFFAATIVFIITLLFGNKINTVISLINTMTVSSLDTQDVSYTYNQETKKLTNYPVFGKTFGTISIPDINVNIALYHGDTLKIIKKGAGHFTGSYFPGENGTVIIDAHNSKEHFGYLYKLKKGALIYIDTTYGKFTYEMTSGEIVNAESLENYPVESGTEQLVLYTCYPTEGIGFRTQRYVVKAKLIGAEYE